jgi:plastocyanin
VDNSARWFLAGIIVSLINTGLVIVFIGIPGITDDDDNGSASATAADRTFVLVVDEEGNVISQRAQLGATSSGGVVIGGAGAGTIVDAGGATLLGLGSPTFVEVEQPAFVSARDGTAYVATRRFELMRVELDGDVDDESLDGVEDLGASRVLDVDVTTDGTLYLLVNDGPLEWRLFQRADDEDEWSLATSGDDVGWPANVVGLSVTDAGVIYVSASDPAGIFRVEPDLEMARSWIGGAAVVGLDAAPNDSLLLFTAPEALPESAADQVRQVSDGRTSVWRSTYRGCGGADDAAAVLVPQLPRDVAIVPLAAGGEDRALVVDSLNHVVWLQEHLGIGEPLFGTPCERGEDEAHLSTPRGVAIDEDGNIFISDTANDRVIILPRTTPLAEVPEATPTPTATAAAEEAAVVEEGLASIQVGIPEACAEGERCVEADRFSPRTLVVSAGETVNFDIRAISHQVAIYGPGTRPEDIDRAVLGGIADTPGADRVLTSATSRVAASPTLPFEAPPVQSWDWNTSDLEAGTYLFICTFEPHFDVGMYGFAIVE